MTSIAPEIINILSPLSYYPVTIECSIAVARGVFSAGFITAYFVPKQSDIPIKSVVLSSVEDELKALKAEFDNSQISEEEYSQKKAEILKRI